MEKTYVFDTAESGGLNSSALIASLMQNKIDALRQENSQLALAASQQAQTASIINQVRPTPSPAYVVANPYCNCGNSYNGCNC
nr:MAG TPA: hypothetical protein [Crassvirales sp.]